MKKTTFLKAAGKAAWRGVPTAAFVVLLALGLVLAGCENPTNDDDELDDLNKLPNKVATPTADPAAGAVAAGTPITLSYSTDEALIYYTIDGTEPTVESTLYSDDDKPIITEETTIKAIAVKDDLTTSDVLTAAYTIDENKVATPTASPAAGAVAYYAAITLECATVGAEIYYTKDGSTPTKRSSPYYPEYKPRITAATTIKAIAVKDGMISDVLIADYTTSPPPPGVSVSITLTPSVTTVPKGETKTFTAEVTVMSEGSVVTEGPLNGQPLSYYTGVTWAVTGGGAGTSLSETTTNGSSTTSTLTVAAGETATSLTVKATSTHDTNKYKMATVTLKAPRAFSVATTSELSAAFSSLGTGAESNTDYTITLTEDINFARKWLGTSGGSSSSITSPTLPTSATNVKITLKGDSQERTLQLTGTGSLFTVGGTFKSNNNYVSHNVTLILDENITLRGVDSNNAPLVTVQLSGKLQIKDGAKIIGNTNTARLGGGVLCDSSGTISMSGGEISGNTAKSTLADYPAMGGGVLVGGQSSHFTMSGGIISGNTCINTNSTGTAFGGGVHVLGSASTGPSFRMTDGIISGNTVQSAGSGGAYGGGVSILGFDTTAGGYVYFYKNGGIIYGYEQDNDACNRVVENGLELYSDTTNAAVYVVSLIQGLALKKARRDTATISHTLMVSKYGAAEASTLGAWQYP
ncbi:MAG: chitobiase/beta-hexosaminidase C-terminal domain-containing protein [Spirochaetaceae bacterium]|jgi:hypothetical protein|nr:chitobiase/beta-hexosaminidase C-terminal domain-containing protein [Spirochaetaceae bacterium]